MATNFKIVVHRNSDNLHLRLLGDFDGSSAHQLINAISKYGLNAYCVFIHTNGMRDIHPFGRDMFQKNLSTLSGRFSGNIIYTGEKASLIAPVNSKLL